VVTDPRTLAEEAKARAENATPGPWFAEDIGESRNGPYAVRYETRTTAGDVAPPPVRHGDTIFIAHARSDVPALADAVLRLVEERDEMRAQLQAQAEGFKRNLRLATEEIRAERDRLVEENRLLSGPRRPRRDTGARGVSRPRTLAEEAR